jgi:hypothetical protein
MERLQDRQFFDALAASGARMVNFVKHRLIEIGAGLPSLRAPAGTGVRADVAVQGFSGLGNLPEKLGPLGASYAAYWLSLPRSDGVPMKRDLDPGAMRKFVANFVIVERRDRRRFTWRLAGSAIRELAGIELTGTDALGQHDDLQREKGLAAYNAQLDTPCGSWGIVMLRSAMGNLVPTEVMVFPLRADDGSLRFLANTVDPSVRAVGPGHVPMMDMKLLSWPEHRFIDIGFGLPKFERKPR